MSASSAASTRKPYVLIMASAGSGKTYTLTLAYVRILRTALLAGNETAAEKMLATTFTRAAAGEIIDRVLKTLAEAVLLPKKCAELSAALEGPPLTQAEASRLLEIVVRHLHRLRICTLDAFLIRAAVAFAPELGLPGAWKIADASEDQRLRLEAIERVLEAHADVPEDRKNMIDLLERLGGRALPRQIAPTLADEFSKTYDAFLAGDRTGSAWDVIGPKSPPLEPAVLDALLAKLTARLPTLVPPKKNGEPDGRWLTWIERFLQQARDRTWEELAKSDQLAAITAGRDATYYRAPVPDAFAEAVRPLLSHMAATLLHELRERNQSSRHLLTHFHALYERIKDGRGAYQFGDFARKLNDAKVISTENREAFFFRLDGQIDHVLLDEFQDTSVPQWKLLQPLVAEVVAGQGADTAPGGRTMLCVGDVKQTLYAWRDAEPRLYQTMLEDWPQIDRQSLTMSYRSAQIVIDAVNAVFGDARANPVLTPGDDEHAYLAAAAATWADWFEEHTTKHTSMPGIARLRTCAAADTARDLRALQINAVTLAADLVEKRLAESPGDEIAVLFRWKKHIPRLIDLLHRRGILAAGEGGSPLTDDPAVCAALSLLHLLDHPGDTAAIYHVAHSPLGNALGLADPADAPQLSRVLRTVRETIADRGFGGALADMLRAIAPGCDDRNHRRFAQLAAAAHAYSGDTTVAAFVHAVREMRVEDASVARVRVMTIHASKGRQFDTVILPDLNGGIGRPASLLTRRPSLLAPYDCITRSAGKHILRLDDTLWTIYQDAMRQDVVEELCGLYVAMTRAKTTLEMIVHPQAQNKNGSSTLPRTMAGILRGALCNGEVEAPPDTLLWEAPGSKTPRRIALEKPAAASRIAVVVRPADPAAARVRPSVSPSSLEGTGDIAGGRRIRLDGKLTFNDSPALDRGTLVHKWFETIDYLADAPPNRDALLAAAKGCGLSDDLVSAALDDFLAACARPTLRGLLARPAGNIELWRERPFAVPVPQGPGKPAVTLTGCFDRVVITREAARDGSVGKPVSADLLDFKTDFVPDAATLAARVEHYKPQIAAYRRALAILLGLPPAAITARLLFLRTDRVVLVP